LAGKKAEQVGFHGNANFILTFHRSEAVMKKYCFLSMIVFAGVLWAASNTCLAQSQGDHPAPDVDGKIWMHSTDQEKKAFLFGAGSAIVLEYHVRDKHAEQPSIFVKGWVDGLKDMSWSQIANKIDQYYTSNPDKMNRHVFEVIWHEIIKPNLKN
jgi:hypothetical protein